MITLIAAMDLNRAIGVKGKLPWHLPADLKRFKKLTSGNIVIMGRKTYESIGKPLPDRDNYIVSRQESFHAPGCFVVFALEEFLNKIAGVDASFFVIGGGEIYEKTVSVADKIELTEVQTRVEGADTFFPAIDPQDWQLTGEEAREADDKNPIACRFLTYERL